MTELSTRQTEILSIAEEIITEEGVQSLTIRHIAERAGITEPAVYRHFKSKNAILLGVLRQFEEGTRVLFQSIPEDTHFSDALETIFKDRLRELSEDTASTAIIFAGDHLRAEPELAEYVSRIVEEHRKNLLAIVTRAQERDQVANNIPADHICAVVMGTIRLVTRRWYDSGKEGNLVKRGMKLFTSILKMVSIDG